MADPAVGAPVCRAIWTELSQRYAHHDDGLLFELLNEPRETLGGQNPMRFTPGSSR